jgi:alpha-D-xyloside xylohydrolase
MFGPDLLIAPVLEPGAKSRRIYLPEGPVWKDALTGKTYKGGRTLDVNVAIDDIPVFTRNGSDFTLSRSH